MLWKAILWERRINWLACVCLVILIYRFSWFFLEKVGFYVFGLLTFGHFSCRPIIFATNFFTSCSRRSRTSEVDRGSARIWRSPWWRHRPRRFRQPDWSRPETGKPEIRAEAWVANRSRVCSWGLHCPVLPETKDKKLTKNCRFRPSSLKNLATFEKCNTTFNHKFIASQSLVETKLVLSCKQTIRHVTRFKRGVTAHSMHISPQAKHPYIILVNSVAHS